mmetsp:Transcript_5548/g.11666  ORF Transcript_5548/g.11666 Transcript_5548/m.11666 type:complete len:219 (-) Transcript_5548:8-664(-)
MGRPVNLLKVASPAQVIRIFVDGTLVPGSPFFIHVRVIFYGGLSRQHQIYVKESEHGDGKPDRQAHHETEGDPIPVRRGWYPGYEVPDHRQPLFGTHLFLCRIFLRPEPEEDVPRHHRAVEHSGQDVDQEIEEVPVVPVSDAVEHPRAIVVHVEHEGSRYVIKVGPGRLRYVQFRAVPPLRRPKVPPGPDPSSHFGRDRHGRRRRGISCPSGLIRGPE